MASKSNQLCLLVLSSLMAASVMTMSSMRASAADKADDVFMDEGDGDFDSAPAPAKQMFPKGEAKAKAAKAEAKVEAPAAVVEAPAPVAKEAPVSAPAPAKEAASERPPVIELNQPAPKEVAAPVAAPSLAEDAAPVVDEDQAAASAKPTVAVPEKEAAAQPTDEEAPAKPVEKKHVAKHAAHSDEAATETEHKTAHHKHMSKQEAGIYVVTNGPCPMTRKPASEEPMITVKPSKKIWVQEVDDKWVRGFNKAGEPGYISRDCVHAAE